MSDASWLCAVVAIISPSDKGCLVPSGKGAKIQKFKKREEGITVKYCWEAKLGSQVKKK
jgi:hypothetical protein